MTLSAIARELGLDRETVSRYVKAIQRDQARALRAKREAALTVSVAHFREIARVAWERADQDGVSALSVALAAEREIARLLGLYHLEVTQPAAPEVRIIIVPRQDPDPAERATHGTTYDSASRSNVVDAGPTGAGPLLRLRDR
jgi:transcriptional regulator with XRE-family HTH domain